MTAVMYLGLLLTVAVAFANPTGDQFSTDKEEDQIALALKVSLNTAAGKEGILSVKDFDFTIKDVLKDDGEITPVAASMMQKANTHEWKLKHIPDSHSDASDYITNKIIEKLGDISAVTKEVAQDKDFKHRFVTAPQYVREVLKDYLFRIEQGLAGESLGPATGGTAAAVAAKKS